MFDRDLCVRLCRERGLALGQRIDHLPVTDSTNDDALGLAKRGAPHGAVVVADAQRRGRGRRGRGWASSAGTGLWFSVLLRGPWRADSLSVVPLVMGLGVQQVVARHIAGRPLVKWPNDVLVDDRKLCGILSETQSRAGEVQAVVVGVGLNLVSDHLTGELAHRATSLSALGAWNVSRELLLAELLAAFDVRLCQLHSDGFLPQWRELVRVDALAGRRVRVDSVEGIAAGVSETGGLLLDTDQGRHTVIAGTVELVS